ncbi:MAG: hypothetical protein D6798_07645 [Deltaproteobacteria bacterium]|nr:MAG: hypothetical protein D6798_07645 [Deltaproteobacteria bacterium]
MSIRHITLAALATLAAAQSASAYELDYSGDPFVPRAWPGTSVTLNVNPSDWASSTRRGAIEDAADAIFENPSMLVINVQEDDDSSIGPNDENELTFTSNSALLCGGPACTHLWYSGVNIVEADIYILNDTYSVGNTKSDNWSYAGNHRSLQTMIIHELGHVAGLMHEDGNYSVMGQDWNVLHAGASDVTPYLDADSGRGLKELYGAWTEYVDLSVSHWGYLGSSGGYSTHERNIVEDTWGVQPWHTMVSREPYYVLDAGEVYRFETTLENKSSTAQTVDIVIVASTDETITTADTELERFENWRLSPGVVEHMLPTYLPEDMNGHYYIGAIIDADGDVSEWDETNNGQYLVETYIW